MTQTPGRLSAVYQILAWLACLGACLGLALVIGLALAGRIHPKADVFNMVWPLPVLAGAAAFAALWLFRANGLRLVRRIGMGVSAGLILIALPYAQLIPRPDALPPRSETGAALRIASFNMWHLNRAPDDALAFLSEGDFDIVLLQEMGGSVRRLPAALTQAYPYQSHCRWGVSVLSRLPTLDHGCDQGERVPVAWIRVEFDGAPLLATSVHFARPTRPDLYQYHRENLALHVNDHSGETHILAGDFNTAEHGFQMAELTRALHALTRVTHGLRTWPSGRLSPVPVIGIDHIWISEGLCATHMGAAPDAGSDHRPVFALIERCER